MPIVKSYDFTRKRTQAIRSNNENINLIGKADKFAFTGSKFEDETAYDCHHWGANKKIMDIISKQDKNLEILRLTEKRQKNSTPGNFRFEIDSKFKPKMWVPKGPGKGRKNGGNIFGNTV